MPFVRTRIQSHHPTQFVGTGISGCLTSYYDETNREKELTDCTDTGYIFTTAITLSQIKKRMMTSKSAIIIIARRRHHHHDSISRILQSLVRCLHAAKNPFIQSTSPFSTPNRHYPCR